MELNFSTQLYAIKSWVILRLPEDVSRRLPSRGQVMVKGSINDIEFNTPLEPDGRGSHWFRVDSMPKLEKFKSGQDVKVSLEAIKEWSEPDVPDDLKKAIAASKIASKMWPEITPLARWEWVRWTRSTSSDETRVKRVRVAISKMESGERRPCCWNRNLCTEPKVSKGGVLLEPYI